MISVSEAQQAAAVIGNGYPVESDILIAAMLATGTKIPGGPSAQIQAINQLIYQHLDAVSAGQAAAASYDLFTVNKVDGQCNISQGQIPAQTVFALRGVGVDLVVGYDKGGTAGATAAPSFSATAVTGVAPNEAKRLIMETGRLRLEAQGDVLLEAPLYTLPIGGGLDAMVSCGVATAGSVYTSNGAPFAGNMRPFGDGAHLLPGGTQLTGKIILPNATVASLGANVYGFYKVNLFGTSFFK